jgi:glycosidase
VGDIPGIISRVPYLRALGVDVVWLSPIFASPQIDMGYDISDYCAVHRPYGTVDDVVRLAEALHQNGMRLLQDLVVNHTSDEHAWFVDSRSSRSAPKRDWYIWHAGYVKDGKRHPPNNWKTSLGGGSVWEWDEATEEYYLHYYDVKMPGMCHAPREADADLNWENPEVREAVYDVMRFWIGKGCDGFRVRSLTTHCLKQMDVIGRISKDFTFPDAPITDPASEWQDAPRFEG